MDANIETHTTTKISTTDKALLNTFIAYEDDANIFTATQRITKTAQAGVAEQFQRWDVSDDANAYLLLWNYSSTDALFAPKWSSLVSNNSTLPGWQVFATIQDAADTGTSAVIAYDARTVLNPIVNRILFSLTNRGTAVLQINAKGNVLNTILAQTGVAEVLQQWKVSDDSLSAIEILNNVSTDGQFVPLIQSSNQLPNSTFAGLYIYGRIPSAQDSGGTPVMVFDSRTTTSTVITNRPLFDFRTAAVSVFKISPTVIDATNKELRNFYVMDKIGQYPCTSMYGVDAWGLLADLQGYGTLIKNLDGTGSAHMWDTGTTAGATCGVAKIGAVSAFNGWMRTAMLPFVRTRTVIPAYTAGDSRLFFGWYTAAGLIPASDTPMDVNTGGILIGYRSTDTNYQIFTGPGDGATAPTVTDTAVVISTSAAGLWFEIRVNSATSVTVTIYNSGGITVLYTNTFTTNMPAGTKSVNFHYVMQNVTAVNKRLTIYGMTARAGQ